MGGAWPILFGSSVGVAIYSHAGIVDFDPGERRTMAPCCRPETDRGKRVFFIYGVLFAMHFHEWKHGSDAGSHGLGKKWEWVYLKYFWKSQETPPSRGWSMYHTRADNCFYRIYTCHTSMLYDIKSSCYVVQTSTQKSTHMKTFKIKLNI